jgi:hypothetical protein
MIEKTAAISPTATSGLIDVPDSIDNSLAKLGRMGMTIPNPKRSMKMVKNNMAIRRSFMVFIEFQV